jgi:murein DD-endopeptidase MepM/ murein hydrolase activator NlpD
LSDFTSPTSVVVGVFLFSAAFCYGVLSSFNASNADTTGATLHASALTQQAALIPNPPPAPPDEHGPGLGLPPLPDEALDELPEAEVPAPERAGDSSRLNVITGHIPKGGTLAGVLQAEGVPAAVIDRIARGMRPRFDFRTARAGEFFALIRNDEGELLSFEYQRGRRLIYRLSLEPDGSFDLTELEVPLERRVVQLGGAIESSLFDAIRKLGEKPQLVHDFADIFIWDFDFATQSRPGDEFRMLLEKYYDRAGFARYGKILAAQYRSVDQDYVAVYFEDSDGYGDYYTPEGSSLRRSFLRAPLRYSHISSRYSKSRLHPILKVRRPHEGIDYAAPTGTPIWAVADGSVVFKGWSGGFGRLVKIRHHNGYISYYGHLSRYADQLEVGSRVRQKQVVGYVGKTGLATGPHLDYRLKINGRFVDPLEVRFPEGQAVSVGETERFAEVCELRIAELQAVSVPLVLEAGM